MKTMLIKGRDRSSSEALPERLERGGPCRLVETEVNGDSKRTNDRGPSLVCLTRRVGTLDFCPALAALINNQPLKNIIFRTVHFFTLLVPIAQQPEQEACWVTFLCVSGISFKKTVEVLI